MRTGCRPLRPNFEIYKTILQSGSGIGSAPTRSPLMHTQPIPRAGAPLLRRCTGVHPVATTARRINPMAFAAIDPPTVSTEPLLLFNWACPFAHRVRLSLAHKKQAIATAHVDLANKPAWLAPLSPHGKVPAVVYIEDGEQQVLYESLALVFWVDEFYKDAPELLPSSAAARTKARIIISRYDSGIGAFYGLLRSRDKEGFAATLTQLHAELKWLEDSVDASGPFLLGATPGLLDAVVAPILLRAPVLKHYKGVDLLAHHPRLQAFVEAYKALPEVAALFQTPDGDGYEAWIAAVTASNAKFAGEPVDFSDVEAAA